MICINGGSTERPAVANIDKSVQFGPRRYASEH
jgi:hypothetical protein